MTWPRPLPANPGRWLRGHVHPMRHEQDGARAVDNDPLQANTHKEKRRHVVDVPENVKCSDEEVKKNFFGA